MNEIVRKMLSVLFPALFALGAVHPLWADYNSLGVPDSAQIRRNVEAVWFLAPLSSVRAKNAELATDEAGATFQIRMEEEKDASVVVVAPESFITVNYVDYATNSVIRTEQRTTYLRTGMGSWLLFRNKENGRPQKIVMYFGNNPDVYVQLRPQGEKTYADVIVYNAYLSRSVPVGVPFENLYRLSFQDIYDLTKKTIPWQSVLVETGLYKESLYMARLIRSRLSSIDYAKNAAYNENGDLYSITTGEPFEKEDIDDGLNYYDKLYAAQKEGDKTRLTLGAPGFSKWIIDGIVEPIYGRGTRISDLIQPTVIYPTIGKQGVLSQTWNLTLNLDWNRNLAAKALSSRSVRGNFTYANGGVDVTLHPFVSVMGQSASSDLPGAAQSSEPLIAPAVGYVQDIGYRIEELQALLYVLAVTEPSWFYLGAVRHTSLSKPDESVFDSTAVFFPYFTDAGVFDCYVFQSGKELTLAQFITQNPNITIHLERVRATEGFLPR